jgi:hypothetical protein
LIATSCFSSDAKLNYIFEGSQSDICGKAISNAMMMTSAARNHATPLKIVSSGIWSPTTLLMT